MVCVGEGVERRMMTHSRDDMGVLHEESSSANDFYLHGNIWNRRRES